MRPRTTLLIAAAAAVAAALTTVPAEARYTAPQQTISHDAITTHLGARTPRAGRGAGTHRHQGARPASLTLSAKRHAGARRHARRGHCDGFRRCRCGTETAAYNGLPLDYMGLNMKKASDYKRLQHTAFGPGVIAVKPNGHHALTVTGGADCHNASIHDDRGDRQRDVCGWTFVMAHGGVVSMSAERRHRTGHRYRHRLAYYDDNNDNFNMGDVH